MEAMVVVSKIYFKILAHPHLSPSTSYATKSSKNKLAPRNAYMSEWNPLLGRAKNLTRILSRLPTLILDIPFKIDFSTL